MRHTFPATHAAALQHAVPLWPEPKNFLVHLIAAWLAWHAARLLTPTPALPPLCSFVAAARGGVRWPKYPLCCAALSAWPTRSALLDYEDALAHGAALEAALQVGPARCGTRLRRSAASLASLAICDLQAPLRSSAASL